MNEFRKEIADFSIEDIELILEDQQDLYTPEEISILKEELENKKQKDIQEKEAEKTRQEAQRIENEQRARETYVRHLYQVHNHMLTTGYNFEGYRIKKYLHVVSGESVMGIGFLSEFESSLADMFGSRSTTFSDKLSSAKQYAMSNMIEQSVNVGGNAIIGVDFDYITFSNKLIGVVANGTSVYIEKTDF